MKRTLALGALWLGPLLLCSACAGVPQEHYFMMAYLPPHEPPEVHKHPYTLRLRPMEITLAYDKEKIVYRYSQFEFEYYHYQLWAVKPQKMITDLLRRHLEKAGVFDRVVLRYTEHRPDYELTGEIVAIEELDSGDSWFAHLAMSFRMTRYRSDRVVWSYEFDVKKPVHNKEPVYVVKALSEIFEKQATHIVNELDAFLHEAPPATPTPAGWIPPPEPASSAEGADAEGAAADGSDAARPPAVDAAEAPAAEESRP